MITPQQIEQRLVALSKEIDEVQNFLEQSERDYFVAKAELEIALARTRLSVRTDKVKFTVSEREDLAIVRCEDQIRAVAIADATVRAARGNAQRVRTQIDIARSVGTSVRASLDN